MSVPADQAGVDLYWLPLGAGGHSVRLNGIVYEALIARLERRRRCDLYHSALEIRVPDGRFVIEMTPVRAAEGAERDVVAGGPVGARWAGRFRIFRYEIRRWRDGFIPDVAEAVDSPRGVINDSEGAQRMLDLVSSVPTPVWGRDERHTGDMWNSNSVVSWLLTQSGLDAESIRPPERGRAPGWHAGLVVAAGRCRNSGPARRTMSREALRIQLDQMDDRGGTKPGPAARPTRLSQLAKLRSCWREDRSSRETTRATASLPLRKWATG
jgi:hypothetical protein